MYLLAILAEALTRSWRIAPEWAGENNDSLTVLFSIETWKIP